MINKNLINFSYNFGGSILPIISTLLSVPIFLEIFGPERYGVLTLFWLLVGYLGLLDLGLGPTLTILLARQKNNSSTFRNRYLRAAIAISILIGISTSIFILISLDKTSVKHLGITEILYTEFEYEIYLLIFIIPLSTVSSVLTGALAANEKFFSINFSIITSTVLFQWLPIFFALLFQPKVKFIIYAVVFAKLIQFIILCSALRLDPDLLDFKKISKRDVKVVLGLGKWISLIKVFSPAMSATDRFIISSSLGVGPLALYNLPYQIAEKIVLFASMITNLLVPKFSKRDEAYKSSVGQASQLILVWVSITANLVGGLFIYRFLEIWISDLTRDDYEIVPSLLVLGFSLNILAHVPSTHMMTNNKSHVSALLLMAEFPAYLMLSFYLTFKYGITGAAGALVVRVLVDTIIVGAISGVTFERRVGIYLPIMINIGIFIAACIGISTVLGKLIVLCVIILLCILIHKSNQFRKTFYGN